MFTKLKFGERVFLLLSGKIGISYKVKKGWPAKADHPKKYPNYSNFSLLMDFHAVIGSGKSGTVVI